MSAIDKIQDVVVSFKRIVVVINLRGLIEKKDLNFQQNNSVDDDEYWGQKNFSKRNSQRIERKLFFENLSAGNPDDSIWFEYHK